MINKIKELIRPKTLEEIETSIIQKQKEAQDLALRLHALKTKTELQKDIDKLKQDIKGLS